MTDLVTYYETRIKLLHESFEINMKVLEVYRDKLKEIYRDKADLELDLMVKKGHVAHLEERILELERALKINKK